MLSVLGCSEVACEYWTWEVEGEADASDSG